MFAASASFDPTTAVLLAGVVLGLASLAKKLWLGTNHERGVVGIVVACSIAAVFLLHYSTIGGAEKVLGHRIDRLSIDDLLVVAVFVSAWASTGWEILGAVKNVGQNV